MKYIVRLTQKRERIVIIDAEDLEEADRKLSKNEIEKEYERIISRKVYGDWEYQPNDYEAVPLPEDMITCAEDLARFYGCRNVSQLGSALYKSTACGICVSWDEEKIDLTGYVEGCDAEHPRAILYFPFSVREFRRIVTILEEEAEDLWDECNDED